MIHGCALSSCYGRLVTLCRWGWVRNQYSCRQMLCEYIWWDRRSCSFFYIMTPRTSITGSTLYVLSFIMNFKVSKRNISSKFQVSLLTVRQPNSLREDRKSVTGNFSLDCTMWSNLYPYIWVDGLWYLFPYNSDFFTVTVVFIYLKGKWIILKYVVKIIR